RRPCSRCRWWCRPAGRLPDPAAYLGLEATRDGPRSFLLVMSCGLPSRPSLLGLLDLHEEALKFRGECVWIDHRRGQFVNQCFGGLACVFHNAAEAPVNGDSDLERLLAVDLHGPDAASDHGFRNVVTARAGD